MYESPITKLMSDISSQMIKEDEDHLMHEVTRAVGYEIDKDELLRALRYDREQYRRGYNDGTREVLQHAELAIKQIREDMSKLDCDEDWDKFNAYKHCIQIIKNEIFP